MASIIRREMFSTQMPMTQLKRVDPTQLRSEQTLKLIQFDAADHLNNKLPRNRNFMPTTQQFHQP